MSQKHVLLSDAGMSPRGVTRRDALRLFIGAGICATFFPSVARATSTQEQLDAAQMSYDEAQSALDQINQEYATIAGQLSQTQAQVVDVSGQIDQKQADIDDKQDEIDTKQADIAAKQEVLGERMSSAYKSGPQSTIDMILSSATFEELTSNIYYLDKVSESDRQMIDEVRTLKAQLEDEKSALEDEKSALESQRSDLETLQTQQQDQLSQSQSKQIEAETLVGGLSSDVQELMGQRDAELAAAQQAAEEARQQARANSNSGGGSGGGSNAGGGSGSGGGSTPTGSGSLSAMVSAAYSTSSPGSGLCAAWVSNVFRNAGVGSFGGNACDMYYSWCGTSTGNIQPGMIIAVPTAPFSPAAILYGHVGIYLGGGTVRENLSGTVQSVSLSSWVSRYSATSLCGWLGGVALS